MAESDDRAELRDRLYDALPDDMVIWADDAELASFPDRTYEWWRTALGHPLAHSGCCKTCGCATPCTLTVFVDSVICSVIRELDRMGTLREPDPASTTEEGNAEVTP